ncbi:maleylpyruvate isomerase family mycothiol-dependent enzyme, partial [Streptomyces sp. SID5785]|uniref:maleylpyruvate isomerase N-terminal domain-containing protein n=1 Tax=Streptomyces sp. SID5785 TaxID=2690309 RepID=UPI001360C98E|nr:maleylpyruvate isomerase family mycothiol-dependent enzyme [Streptomyces sp. SID5785]
MRTSPLDPDELVLRVAQAHTRLLDLTGRLSDRQKDAASTLPGWSRGHVLAHLADNARAFERQARAALAGDLVDLYDGGQQERDRSIDRGATHSAARLHEDLDAAQRALEGVWS